LPLFDEVNLKIRDENSIDKRIEDLKARNVNDFSISKSSNYTKNDIIH
jgi:hypothetical protein